MSVLGTTLFCFHNGRSRLLVGLPEASNLQGSLSADVERHAKTEGLLYSRDSVAFRAYSQKLFNQRVKLPLVEQGARTVKQALEAQAAHNERG